MRERDVPRRVASARDTASLGLSNRISIVSICDPSSERERDERTLRD
jgi:hypothetical protein